MTDRMPERVGPYRLQSRLGAGGMGEVFLALDPDGRAVAVKLLHPGSDAAAHARLAREAATMRRVRGPHVAEVIDTGRLGDRPYVVTRYVQGRPLDAVVRETGPLAGEQLLRVARGLAEALVAIHAAGVVHRDLKPANVMLVDGTPVVIDFGIAYAAASTRVTQTDVVVGTAGFVAPEMLRGERAGPAADIFAWSATVVYAATGRSAFGSGTVEQIFYRVLHERPRLDGVPTELRALVAAGLSRDPDRRPTAVALRDRLAESVPPDGSAAASVATGERPSTAVEAGSATAAGDPSASGAGAASEPRGGAPPTASSGEPAATVVAAPSASREEPVRWRSHAARRRAERMRRIRVARRDEPVVIESRRATWWLVAFVVMFATGMGAADDYLSASAALQAHAGYGAIMAISGAVSWLRRRRAGAPGALRRAVTRFGIAALAGSGLAVLLGWLVPSTVMIFVVGAMVVLAVATLMMS